MRIAVVNDWAPFIKGGAEHLADALTRKLVEYGHQATLVRLPFSWTPPAKILEHVLACRCMGFSMQRIDSRTGEVAPLNRRDASGAFSLNLLLEQRREMQWNP